MRVVVLPDLHEQVDLLSYIAHDLRACDLLLLPGDVVMSGKRAAPVLDALAVYQPQILAIPGNWDDTFTQALFRQRAIDLHRRVVERGGVLWMGVGLSLPVGWFTSTATEQQFADYLADTAALLPAGRPFILVTHEPPYGTLHMRSTGSRAIRAFIEQHQPLVCFCGHIHEAAGIDHLGRTLIVNAGPLMDGGYAWAETTPDVVTCELRRWKSPNDHSASNW